jgi:hypothetical protein
MCNRDSLASRDQPVQEITGTAQEITRTPPVVSNALSMRPMSPSMQEHDRMREATMSEREYRELTRREAVRLLGAGAVSAKASFAEPAPPATTIAALLDRQITDVEKQIVELAEAMPESKFGFSPERLGIPGSDYKGVRTFAVQIRHVAASNYALWSGITGDAFPDDFMGGDGPERLRSKAEILRFLRDSFALGHKAAATLTAENMLLAAKGAKSMRLEIATFAVSHAFDHYGQMVEYVRMNGIVPPASRGPAAR